MNLECSWDGEPRQARKTRTLTAALVLVISLTLLFGASMRRVIDRREREEELAAI